MRWALAAVWSVTTARHTKPFRDPSGWPAWDGKLPDQKNDRFPAPCPRLVSTPRSTRDLWSRIAFIQGASCVSNALYLIAASADLAVATGCNPWQPSLSPHPATAAASSPTNAAFFQYPPAKTRTGAAPHPACDTKPRTQ